MPVRLSCRCGEVFQARPGSGDDSARCPACGRRVPLPDDPADEPRPAANRTLLWVAVGLALVGFLALAGVTVAVLLKPGKPAVADGPPPQPPAEPPPPKPADPPDPKPGEGTPAPPRDGDPPAPTKPADPPAPKPAPPPDPSPSGVAEFASHPGRFVALAVTPDGTEFVAATAKTVSYVATATGKKKDEFPHAAGSAVVTAVSPDGAHLAVASVAGRVFVQDVREGKPLEQFDVKGGFIKALAFSPDGKRLFVFGPSNGAVVWDRAEGRQAGAVPLKGSPALVSATPDGRKALANTGFDGLAVIDLAAGKVERTVEAGGAHIGAAAIAPHGRWAVLARTRVVIAVDLGTGRRSWEVPVPGFAVTALAVSGDGSRVFAACRRTTAAKAGEDPAKFLVIVWDERGGEVCRFPALAEEAAHVVPGRDGLTAVTAHRESLKVWRLPAGRAAVVARPGAGGWPGPGESVELPMPGRLVAISPDSRLALRASGAQLALHELPSGRELGRWVPPGGLPGDSYTSVAFTHDGARAVTADGRGKVRVWDVATGTELRSWDGGGSVVRVSPGGRRAVTAGQAGVVAPVRLWDLENGKKVTEWPGRPPVAFAANGEVVLFNSPAGMRAREVAGSREWGLGDGGAAPAGPAQPMDSFILSPDGRTLLTLAPAADVWDVGSGVKLGRLSGEEYQVPLGFTTDGRRAVTVGLDRTVRVWDLGTGKQTGRVQGNWEQRTRGAVTADGRFALLFGRDDQTDRVILVGLPEYKPPPFVDPRLPELVVNLPPKGEPEAEFRARVQPRRMGERTELVLFLVPAGGPAVDAEVAAAAGDAASVEDAPAGRAVRYSVITRGKVAGYRFEVADEKEPAADEFTARVRLAALPGGRAIDWAALGKKPRLTGMVVRSVTRGDKKIVTGLGDLASTDFAAP